MTIHKCCAPTHPGEMLLKEFLEPLGVTQEAAKRMSIPFQRLNAIVKGRRGLDCAKYRDGEILCRVR